MSLRLRLIGTMTVVLLVVLALGSVLGYRQTRRTTAMDTVAAIEAAASDLRQAVTGIQHAARPHEDLLILVHGFDGNRLVRVDLVDAAGRTRATSRPPGRPPAVPAWFLDLYGGPYPVETVPVPGTPGGNALFRVAGNPLSDIAETWHEGSRALAALAAFFLVGVVALVALVDQALRPLSRFGATFRRVGAGDYAARIDPTGPPEIAALAAHFNQMAERLEAADARSRRLAGQIAAIQDEERAELARDLHDEVGPFLFAIDVDAAALERAARDGTPAAALVRDRAKGIRAAAGAARGHVRTLLDRLRGGVVDRLGLASAVDELVDFWSERAPQVAFQVTIDQETFGSLDPVLNGIVREAVNNALRHALPTEISILVKAGPDAMITAVIADNGGGLREQREHAGLGLIGMKERVAAVGGSLVVEDRSDTAGVRIVATLPGDRAGPAAGETPQP